MLDWGFLCGSEIRSQRVESDSQTNTDSGQHSQTPILGVLNGHPEGNGNSDDTGDFIRAEHGFFRVVSLQEFHGNLLPNRNSDRSNNGGDYTNTADDQGINNPLQAVCRIN